MQFLKHFKPPEIRKRAMGAVFASLHTIRSELDSHSNHNCMKTPPSLMLTARVVRQQSQSCSLLPTFFSSLSPSVLGAVWPVRPGESGAVVAMLVSLFSFCCHHCDNTTTVVTQLQLLATPNPCQN